LFPIPSSAKTVGGIRQTVFVKPARNDYEKDQYQQCHKGAAQVGRRNALQTRSAKADH
jgi:hypothetical protein